MNQTTGTQPTPRQAVISVLVLLVFSIWFSTVLVDGASGDLLALWLAAQAFADGQYSEIYTPTEGLFTMLPPSSWETGAIASGHNGPYYPYVYPPLIAALLSPLTKVTTFTAFKLGASYANTVFLLLTAYYAARAGQTRFPLAGYLMGACFLISVSSISLLAMYENQPQIFVGLLLMFVVERTVTGRSGTAGAILAAAAALKVYPAFFILVYIITRDWRAVRVFAITGGLLGGASIVLAGWPLHQEFLDQLSSISGTVLATTNSYNFNALWAVAFHSDEAIKVPAAVVGEFIDDDPGWMVLPKGIAWQALTNLLTISAIAFVALKLRRQPERTATLLAGLIGLVSFVLPISWPYYFIPLLAFGPVLLDRYGAARAIPLLFLCMGPSVIGIPNLIKDVSGTLFLALFLSVAGAVVLTAAFIFAPAPKARP